MKFKFENLGPIKSANLELGDLTIICGDNNTGKTYISYAIYGFLNNYQDYLKADKNLVEKITTGLDENNGEFSIPLNKIIGKSNGVYLDTSRFSKSIQDIFSCPEEYFDDFKFEFTGKFPEIKTGYSDFKEEYLAKIQWDEEKWISLGITNDNKILTVKCHGSKDFHSIGMPVKLFSTVLGNVFGNILMSKPFPKCHISTSERLSISLFYKELDEHRNVLVDTLQNMIGKEKRKNIIDPFEMVKKAAARYAVPIKDNINSARNMDVSRKKLGSFIKENPSIDRYMRNMIDGRFFHDGNEIFFKSRHKKNPLTIPLYLGSASLRSLSDIFLYLRHIAKPGDMLIIDEPETNLSAQNQVKMTRFLSILINAGMKIIITTHSDYIVREFTNLIMLNNDFSDKDSFRKNFKYSDEEFLDHRKVKAYQAIDGKVLPCPVDNRGIVMKLFDKEIERQNQVVEELDFILDGMNHG